MGHVNLVFAGNPIEGPQDFLKLSWEHVDPVNLEHVVASSLNNIEARIFASAAAPARNDSGNVVGTESDERRSLLLQCGYYDFTLLTVRQGFAGNRVDYLDVEIVIPVVDTPFPRTVHADSRTVDFRETVYVIELYAQLICDVFPFLVAPSLAADHSFFKVDFIPEAPFVYLLSQQQGVA